MNDLEKWEKAKTYIDYLYNNSFLTGVCKDKLNSLALLAGVEKTSFKSNLAWVVYNDSLPAYICSTEGIAKSKLTNGIVDEVLIHGQKTNDQDHVWVVYYNDIIYNICWDERQALRICNELLIDRDYRNYQLGLDEEDNIVYINEPEVRRWNLEK